jgi:hypothetical protein
MLDAEVWKKLRDERNPPVHEAFEDVDTIITKLIKKFPPISPTHIGIAIR